MREMARAAVNSFERFIESLIKNPRLGLSLQKNPAPEKWIGYRQWLPFFPKKSDVPSVDTLVRVR